MARVQRIGQIKMSAIRKALQGSFSVGIVEMLKTQGPQSKQTQFYGGAWRWMLTLACLRRAGISENADANEICRMAIELGIHGKEEGQSIHQTLFDIGEMEYFNDDAIVAGNREISSSSIISKIPSRHREGIEDPWFHILPEDIGSCFEVVVEARPEVVDRELQLVHKDDRRRSGVHHTPFDVTERMVDIAFDKKKIGDSGVPSPFVICDLAVGAGAFLVQATRILVNMSQGAMSTDEVLRKHIIGFDIDEQSIKVANLCLHMEAGFPDISQSYNLHCIDSVGEMHSREFIQGKIKSMSLESRGVADITLGNPPYVQYKQDSRESLQELGYATAKTNNLSAIFLEQALEITEIGGVVCQIIPISIVQSAAMEAVRSLLLSRSSEIRIEAFDCVPGYIFDQGKIGSNSNRSITRQVAIVSAVRGDLEAEVRVSRMIRWGSSERDELFDSVELVGLPNEWGLEEKFPMLGDPGAVQNFGHMLGLDSSISNLYGNGRFGLYITKAVRYFITGTWTSLGRRNELTLKFDERFPRDLAMVIVNSSFFYWYWKVVGNGFQVNRSEVSSLRIPSPSSIRTEFRDEVTRMANRLSSSRGRLKVEKSNRGIIRNVKYDLDRKLMSDLDELVDKIYEFPISSYPFYASKSNNLRDYSLLMQQQ